MFLKKVLKLQAASKLQKKKCRNCRKNGMNFIGDCKQDQSQAMQVYQTKVLGILLMVLHFNCISNCSNLPSTLFKIFMVLNLQRVGNAVIL